jgi:CIC family chloride channel protein
LLVRTSEPLELELLGRTLLHSVLIGAAAGLIGSLFYYLLELTERVILEGWAGYEALRAGGEEIGSPFERGPFRPSLLWVLPAVGALLGGLLSSRFAPETRGGGADAIIRDFHHNGGRVRRRVPLVKALASILTLGFGGSGGREGPTMQIGGAIGSLVGRALGVDERERRILLVAGLAAGVSAVFRTPLGAALLAVEVLHRDDFESDALVPSVLASVTSYSVFISFFGEATLFTHAPRYPFVPGHLPLFAAMALVISLGAIGFLKTIDASRRLFTRLPVPDWLRPACGGLVLGTMVVPILIELGPRLGGEGRGIGLLGGGYGAAQLAITGAPWLPGGWYAVELLALLAVLKAIATSLTLGSGGSAGDFGPSLVVGALIGGAFGRAAQLLLNDPRIDPGAFALFGMGTFYGGLAHVPIASLVLVCELAGSYDLLVPLMLSAAIAFVGLRKHSLYPAQVRTKRESPAHRDDLVLDVLREVKVGDALVRDRAYVSFRREANARQILERAKDASDWQDIFPVLADDGKLLGSISTDRVRDLAIHPDLLDLTLAIDVMAEPAFVLEHDDLHTALERMLAHGTREIVVLDGRGTISGFLDESEIQVAYHEATTRAPNRPPPNG